MEYSKGRLPFLDILIKKNKNGIWMDLHHKATDTQRGLPFTSSHPSICKQKLKFKSIKIPLPRFATKTKITEGPFNTTKKKDLRKPKKPSNENILLIITTFTPNNPNSHSTIKSSVSSANNNFSDFDNIKLM